MSKKLTNEEYVAKVYELVGNEYIPLEEYINTKTKIMMQHIICGTKYPVSPNKFFSGRRCPNCAIGTTIEKLRKSFELLCDDISNINNGEFEVVGGKTAYKNNRSNIMILHKICNRKFKIRISNFLVRKTCPACSKDAIKGKNKKTNDIFIIELNNKYHGEYTPLEPYVRAVEKILVRHNICNREWRVSPSNLLRGFGCPFCAIIRRKNSQRKSIESLLNEVKIIGHGEYLIMGEYHSYKDKIKMKHTICGTEFDILIGNFLKRGDGCPACSIISKGEDRIKRFLISHNINYKKNKTFSDCRDKKNLSFDFKIDFGKNNDDFVLIEYNGMQHYKYCYKFGSLEDFEKQKIHDEIKIKYCRDNNIKLIIIPYWKLHNIEEILESEILCLLEGGKILSE